MKFNNRLLMIVSMVLLLSSFVNSITEDIGESGYSSSSYATAIGMSLEFNQTVYLQNVTRVTGSDGTGMLIYNSTSIPSDPVLIKSTDLTSNTYTFSDFPLYSGNTYYILENKSGSMVWKYKQPLTYPDDTGFITWNGEISTPNPSTFQLADTRASQIQSLGFLTELEEPPVVSNVTNTSFYMVDFNISDLTFSSNTYFDAFVVEYNVTQKTNFTLATAFNVVKNSGGGTNIIYGKVITGEGVVLAEEVLRTVTGTGSEGSTGFFPMFFEEEVGVHNLTVQFRRDGNGQIEINDIDMVLMQLYTTQNQTVRGQLTENNGTFDYTSLTSIVNWTVDIQNSYMGLYGKMNINSTSPTISQYTIGDQLTNSTRTTIRDLTSADEVGSLGGAWLNYANTSPIVNLFALTDGSPVSYDTKIYDFDFKDALNNTVGVMATELNTTLTLNAGSNLISGVNLTSNDGDSILAFALFTFNSTTGEQTPSFILNSTNSSLDCYTKKERTVSSNANFGNVWMLTMCDSGIETGKTYTFQTMAEIGTGEQINVISAGLFVFESTKFDITKVATPKELNILTDLVNNTINFNDETLTIGYNFTLGVFNTIDQANCSLLIDDVVEETQTLRNDSTNYFFNPVLTSTEANTTFEIQCSNTEVTDTTGVYNYRIDNIVPRISICNDFVNLTSYELLTSVSICTNLIDPNLFAYNNSLKDSNDNVLNNVFEDNLSVSSKQITLNYVVDTVGIYTYEATIWDSHTAKKIKPNYKIDYVNNGFTVNDDIMFSSPQLEDSLVWFDLDRQDRYKFKMTFQDDSLVHSFTLETSEDAIYLPNSEYLGHFVYLPLGKWIDLESSNVKSVNVTTISQNKYNIIVNLYKSSDEVEFDSIGDLNTVTYIYTFSVAQATGITGDEMSAIFEEFGGMMMFVFLWIFAFIILILCLIYYQNHYMFYIGLPVSVMLVFMAVNLYDNFVTANFPRILNAMYSIQWIYLFLVIVGIFARVTISMFSGDKPNNKKRDVYEEYDY